MIEQVLFNPNQPPRKKNKKVLIIVTVILVVVTLFGAILIIMQQVKKNTSSKVTNEEQQPSPTEKPKIEKESVKIQVLNGTGIPGQAGSVVNILKEAGYSSDNIKTDNADNFDNSVTNIAAKTSYEEIASDIKSVLEDKFDEIEVDSSPLDEENEFDIVITTGGKKPTSTPTTLPDKNLTPSPTETNTTPTPTPTTTITLTPTP